ncbi:MAG: terminase large subunit [Firmicutes bacterium]|nr:terminase large subunit [Bacillota bacterium]
MEVVQGLRIVGKYERLACERHLRDLGRQGTEEFPYIFDENKANRVYKWFQFCRHVKGPKAGRPIELEPFQKFELGSIFGWVHKDTGRRRFRKAYSRRARKNGKSTQLSGVGLYMLGGDKEIGAEVYCTATKKDQARIVYNDAKVMAENSPDIKKRLKIRDYLMTHKLSNSIMKPLSKDTKTADGLNPHLGIIDEYHAHPDDSMYNVLVSGQGQRLQPLLYIITTSGFETEENACYKEDNYCKKILEGDIVNESYFVFIQEMDEDDDVHDPANWIKANPLLASTPEGMAYLQQQHDDAFGSGDPDKIRNFLVKNLNKWVNAKKDGYMAGVMDKWKALAVDGRELYERLRGQVCNVGVDLSKKIDLTSITFEFYIDGKAAVVSHSFIPEDTVVQKRKTDKVPYDMWAKQGWISITPGAVVDYRFITAYIHEVELEYGWKINEICYDPYNATQFANEMADEGYTMVEIRQGVRTLSEPTKDFRERVLKEEVIHDGNPVLTWALSNAVTKADHNENIMLDKSKSTERIDPAAATINTHVRFEALKDQIAINDYVNSDDFSL